MLPEEADYYNGRQGDEWDALKDMVMAMRGFYINGNLLFV
jgi:uncharacterized membrane protein YjdF